MGIKASLKLSLISLLQAFLLFDGLDREEWAQKLAESRDAYGALRAHFLKYIERPDDLESTVDPLADDEQVSRIIILILCCDEKCLSD